MRNHSIINGFSPLPKIDGLNALIGQEIVEGLHSIRFLGNDAAHELEKPNKEEAWLAIDICEGLLNFLYGSIYNKKAKL